jgi:hypothetical protein
MMLMTALHLTSGFPGNAVIWLSDIYCCIAAHNPLRITDGIIFLGGGDGPTLLHQLDRSL